MTYKNAKTILFAGLIAAMILPFSGMQFATAEEEQTDLREKQQKILDKIYKIEERIAKSPNDNRVQVLEDKKQVLLKKLMDNAPVSNVGKIIVEGESPSNQVQIASAGSQYNINGVENGCNGQNLAWNVAGVMTPGSQWFTMSHYYPPALSIGTDPNCYDDDWDSLHYVKAKDVFSSNGCEGYLITSNQASYSLNCQTPINGLWVVEVRGYYDSQHTSGYTYVAVI